jgi:hypothetical protein
MHKPKGHLLLWLWVIPLLLSIRGKGQEIYDSEWIAYDTNSFQISVIAFWPNKSSREYFTVHHRNGFQGDSLLREKIISKGLVEFAVRDSTDSTYTMNYLFKENLKDESLDIDFNLEEVIPILDEENIHLAYTTNEIGTLKSYDNHDAYMNNLELIVNYVKQGIEAKDSAQSKVIEALLDKKNFYDSFTGVYVSNFHFVHGLTIGIDDTLYYKQHNGILEEECYLYVSYYDTLTHEVGFTIEQYGDQEALTNYTKSKLKTINSDLDYTNMTMTSFIKKYLYIDTKTGWPTFLKVIKEIIQYDSLNEVEYTNQDVWTLSFEPIED